MEREPRSRGAASVPAAAKTAKRPGKRAMGSRVGLRRANGAPARPSPQPHAAPGRPAPEQKGRPAPARPAHSQPARPAPARASAHGPAPSTRRVTKVERIRQRRRRALLGFLLVLAVLVVGLLLSFQLLFKVRDFRIEDLEGNTPADTGIYSEDDILSLLALEPGDDLLGFSTADKTRELAAQLPYLDTVTVHVQLPGTVVVKLSPARERFAVQGAGGSWLVLSEQRKILRTAEELPAGLIALSAPLPADFSSVAGQYLDLLSYNSLQAGADSEAAPTPAPDGTANEMLAQMLEKLGDNGLLDGCTALSLEDLSELGFTYEDRVTVRLGTANSLEDKLYIAARALLDIEGNGLGASDCGTLEFFQNAGGELRAYFHPYDPNASQADDDAQPDDGADGEGDAEGDGGEDGQAGEAGEDGAGSDSPQASPSPTPQAG